MTSTTARPPGRPVGVARARPHAPARPADVLLADRPDGTVVRSGHTVAKAHAPDCDTAALAARLRIAAHPSLHGILLPPLPVTAPGGHLTLAEDGRALTRWPYGSPVPPDDPDAAPWEDAARLLARLHSVDVAQLPGPVPPMRGPAKAARALTRLRAALARRRRRAPPRPGRRRPSSGPGHSCRPGPATPPAHRAAATSATATSTSANSSGTRPPTAPGC